MPRAQRHLILLACMFLRASVLLRTDGVQYFNPAGGVNPGQVHYNYAEYRNAADVTISFVHIGSPTGPANVKRNYIPALIETGDDDEEGRRQ